MEKHVLVVGALNIGFSLIWLFIATIVFIGVVGGGRISGDPDAIRITSFVGPIVAFFFGFLALPGLIGGIGLIKHRNWARILVLVLSVMGLMNIDRGLKDSTGRSIFRNW